MEGLEELSVAKIPDLDLSQQIFELSLSDDVVSSDEKTSTTEKVQSIIKENNMKPLYETLCTSLKWKPDEHLIGEMSKANEDTLKQMEETINDAEENLGESEVREGFLARAEFYSKIGDKKKAIFAYRQTAEKTVALGQKLDIAFAMIRIGFFHNDNDLIRRNIEKAHSLMELGGDWDRRNRLKVYEGLFLMTTRKFDKAATLLLEVLATFTSYELFPYKDFIRYAILMALIALDRPKLKEKVISAPEILTVIDDIPIVGDFLNSFYNSEYSRFFTCLADITDSMKKDQYLFAHVQYYCREMRIRAYTQLLASYKSVKLSSMAEAFGVSEDFIDRELSRFIASDRLYCKIDKVAGIVETTRPDSRASQYQDTIKQGDLLISRLSKLSRVITL